MVTFMQAAERLRERGILPGSGGISARSLHQRFQPTPRGSVRALLLRMFEQAAIKAPWSIILCRFKGQPANLDVETPIEGFYRGVFRAGTGGLVEYWRDVSLGMIDISGSRVFGWVEIDIERAKANTGSGVGRGDLIDAAVAAAQRNGFDAVNGFHRQIAVYTENWSIDGVPAGLDWSDPQWGQFWIDGSADGRRRVCLTPPHNGNICAHEMGHGFDMNHDLGADLVSDYQDPCCIMSQNNPFIHPTWMTEFGPALCLPHLVQRGWMYARRLYHDDGGWLARPDGITLPLASLTNPNAHANLGIKLTYRQNGNTWDYYLEYVQPTGWNQAIAKSFLFIRRMAPHETDGENPAYLGSVEVPTALGAKAEFVEPSGNVRFQVERFDAGGRVVKVRAQRM